MGLQQTLEPLKSPSGGSEGQDAPEPEGIIALMPPGSSTAVPPSPPCQPPALTIEPARVVLLRADGGTPAQAAEDGKVTAHQIGGHPRVELLAWQAPREALQGTPSTPEPRCSQNQAHPALTHKDRGGCMPGVIRALPLAILNVVRVQLENRLLERGKDGRWAGGSSWGLWWCQGTLTSACWPASTKAQTGWKAPVPQAYRWVRL